MKNFLLVIIFTCWSTLTFAQKDDFKTEHYIGFSGGETFTKVRFHPNIIESYLLGNSMGIVYRLISEPHIGFQAEVNMTQKGWKEDSVGYSRRLNYITIPIMTHINLGKKAVRFTLNLGPEIGFKLSEDEKFSDPSTSQPGGFGNREFFGQPIDSKIDLLFTVGMGMEYHLKNGSAFALEGRGFYSLPNIFSNKTYSYSLSQSNGLQVKLAYLFQLNKKLKR